MVDLGEDGSCRRDSSVEFIPVFPKNSAIKLTMETIPDRLRIFFPCWPERPQRDSKWHWTENFVFERNSQNGKNPRTRDGGCCSKKPDLLLPAMTKKQNLVEESEIYFHHGLLYHQQGAGACSTLHNKRGRHHVQYVSFRSMLCGNASDSNPAQSSP